MFGWLKRRRPYQLGQEAATAIVGEIEERIAARVVPASDRFMDVLRQRLGKLWDNPAVDSRTVLRAEWDEFERSLGDFLGEMQAEINIKNYKWDEIIDGTGMRETLDEFIREQMTAVKDSMMQRAATMITGAVEEIERREKQRPAQQDDALDGEAKEVMRIKMICEVARGSAEAVREGKVDAEWFDHERKRYEKHRAMALDASKTLTDKFYRDAATHSIIDLCMIAGDRKAARALFRSVHTSTIRDEILEAHPMLRV
jgi:hypothetical protein